MKDLSIWEQVAVIGGILVIALFGIVLIYRIYLSLNKWH